MEELLEAGFIAGSLDVTTTEFCDLVVGGVLAAVPGAARVGREGAASRRSSRSARSTWSTSARCDTVPERYRDRNLYVHNPTITLMRTTPDECREIGAHHRRQAQRRDRADGALRPAARRLDDRDGGSGLPRRRGRRGALRRRCARRSTRRRSRCTSSTRDVNDPAFALAMANRLHELIRRTRMTRGEALARLRAQIDAGKPDHRRRRRHRPLREVRRGGRRRPDHHLQLRPLPDGRPRLARRA